MQISVLKHLYLLTTAYKARTFSSGLSWTEGETGNKKGLGKKNVVFLRIFTYCPFSQEQNQ